METEAPTVDLELLPFYITAPGESDILFVAVAVALVAVVIGFGALYFTIQAIPDRIAKGTSKAQMQLVGLLGLISLFTMNNLYWIAAILIAAVRIPDFVTPLQSIAASLAERNRMSGEDGPDRAPANAAVPIGSDAPSQSEAETGTAPEKNASESNDSAGEGAKDD